LVKVLVAYYSLSGYTESLARAVIERLAVRAGSGGGHQATLLEIVPVKAYSYYSAGVKGVTQAMAGTIVDLQTPPPPDSFDAVVVLSPTWGWMSSPPVRSFVHALPPGEERPAVVGVTHAGGPIGSFDRLAGLVEERGYRVLERLSVFCYSREAIAEAAARTAAVLDGVAVVGSPQDRAAAG
jgi:hypothetical protein